MRKLSSNGLLGRPRDWKRLRRERALIAYDFMVKAGSSMTLADLAGRLGITLPSLERLYRNALRAWAAGRRPDPWPQLRPRPRPNACEGCKVPAPFLRQGRYYTHCEGDEGIPDLAISDRWLCDGCMITNEQQLGAAALAMAEPAAPPPQAPGCPACEGNIELLPRKRFRCIGLSAAEHAQLLNYRAVTNRFTTVLHTQIQVGPSGVYVSGEVPTKSGPGASLQGPVALVDASVGPMKSCGREGERRYLNEQRWREFDPALNGEWLTEADAAARYGGERRYALRQVERWV